MAQDIYIKFKGDATNLTATVDRVDRALRGLDRSSQRASASLSRIDNSARAVGISLRTVVGALAAFGSGVAVRGVVNAYTEFESFRTVLTTFLGSAEMANAELGRMQTLANSLPQDLNDITRAFTIFSRFGIDTTNESLTAFSNIATANAKSLTQLAEAVADGMTGEFERFKEFGIKVSKESGNFVARIGNDQVALATSTEELISQLMRLGEEGGRFGGAAAANAGTLTQAFSNLRGTVNSASIALMQGMSPALIEVVNKISETVAKNEELIKSIGRGLGEAVSAAATAFGFLIDNLDRIVAYGTAAAGVWVGYKTAIIAAAVATGGLSAALAVLRVALIRTGIGAIIVALGEAILYMGDLADEVGGLKNAFIDVGKRISLSFQGAWVSVREGWARLLEVFQSGFNWIKGQITEAFTFDIEMPQWYKDLTGYGDISISGPQFEDSTFAQGAIESARAAAEAYESARLEYEAWHRATVAANTPGVGRGTAVEKPGERAAYMRAQLEASNRVTAAANAEAEAIRKLGEEYRKQPTNIEAATSAMEFYVNSSEQQLASLQKQYENLERGLNLLADQSVITEQERAREILRIKTELARKVSEVQQRQLAEDMRNSGVANEQIVQGVQQQMQAVAMMQQGGIVGAQGVLSSMMQISGALGTQNKKAFETHKRLAVAQALISTYQAAAMALASAPWPFSMLLVAGAVAAGMAQVAAINSQQYSGRALGGPVMGNTPYLVGENGPEIFTPATSGRVTRNNQIGEDRPVNINFTINAIDAQGIDQVLVGRKSVIQQIVSDAMVEAGQRSRF